MIIFSREHLTEMDVPVIYSKVKGSVVGLGNTVGMAIGVLVEEMAS